MIKQIISYALAGSLGFVLPTFGIGPREKPAQFFTVVAIVALLVVVNRLIAIDEYTRIK